MPTMPGSDGVRNWKLMNIWLQRRKENMEQGKTDHGSRRSRISEKGGGLEKRDSVLRSGQGGLGLAGQSSSGQTLGLSYR